MSIGEPHEQQKSMKLLTCEVSPPAGILGVPTFATEEDPLIAASEDAAKSGGEVIDVREVEFEIFPGHAELLALELL